MKKTILFKGMLLFLLSLFASGNSVYSQGCLPAGIIFSTQSQIDDFAINNPGCNRIIGNVTISESVPGNIVSLSGLSIIDSIDGSLSFLDNNSLATVSGFNNLLHIGGNLIIFNNQILRGISALANLTGTVTNLSVAENPKLKNLVGLAGLTGVTGYFNILENSRMLSLAGLDNITSIGGYFSVADNDSLVGLGGLDKLTSVGADFWLTDNAQMHNLSKLTNLVSINGVLTISENDVLVDLTGLDNIDPASIDTVVIKDNPMLTICAIQSVCDHLAASGESDISNNATGCNSKAEVTAACGNISIDEWSSIKPTDILVYPNPARDIIIIEVDNLDGSELHIYSLTGILMQTNQLSEDGQVDISGLANGLYLLEVRAENSITIGKILKE